MRFRKVYRIYSALPDQERAAFGLYLASPYFGTHQRLGNLRALLEEALVQQPEQNLSPEEVWRLLPDVSTDFRANGFDKLCAELLAALNDFLAMQAYRAHPVTVASHQLQAYVDFHLVEWVPGVYEGLIERLGAYLERDAAGIYGHLSLLHAYGQHLFKTDRMPSIFHLLQIDQKLNEFFFARKLELAAAVDAYNRGYKSTVELPYLDLLKEVLDKGIEGYPPLVQVQALSWLMTRYRDPKHYFALKSLLEENKANFPVEDIQSFYWLALNYCYWQVNAENEEFDLEADEIHMHLLDEGMMLTDGKLIPGMLKNIVQVRLRLGKVEWVAEFLDVWASRISDDPAGAAIRYHRALLAFEQGQFSRCLRDLEVVMRDFKADIHYGVDARAIALMCVYEINKTDDWSQEFGARLNAFRLYLIRDEKMGEERKLRRLNLIKQFRKLMSLSNEAPSQRRAKAVKMLEGLKNLKPASNRKWFEKQVSDFLD